MKIVKILSPAILLLILIMGVSACASVDFNQTSSDITINPASGPEDIIAQDIIAVNAIAENISPEDTITTDIVTENDIVESDVAENDPTSLNHTNQEDKVHLSLGDTFQFKNFEVTLGDEIEFVFYHITGTNLPEIHERRNLYIPVTVTYKNADRDDIEITAVNSWPLTRTMYYNPDGIYSNTFWHDPGYEESLFLFRWENPAYVETHIQLLYSDDGPYTLQFNLKEESAPFEIIQVFELLVDVIWPTDYTSITIEYINRSQGGSFKIGNFQMTVNSEFTFPSVSRFDEYMAVGITLFPITLTNIGPENKPNQYLSTLNPVRLNSNCGFPVTIGYVYSQGTYIPLSEVSLPPGGEMHFHLPIEAFVCENTAWYRSFQFTEKIADPLGNITIKHHLFDICVSEGC